MPALPFIQLSLPVESLLRFNLSELELHVKTVILITCKNSKEVDHSDIPEIFLKNEIKIISFSVCIFQAGTKSLEYQYLYILSCLDLTIL